MKHALVLTLLAFSCLADTGWKNANVNLGPVIRVDCTSDGGIYCTRTASSAQGNLRCANATKAEIGCVTPSAQEWAGDKTLQANMRAQKFGGADGGNFVKLPTGISLPQSGSICANSYALTGQGANSRMIGGSQMRSAGQFVQLTGVLSVPGVPDGGVSADGGTQSYTVDVYDFTTSKLLCSGNEVDCAHAVNPFGWSVDNCGRVDGGALFAVDDYVYLRINDVSCLRPPVVNVCAEYQGLP